MLNHASSLVDADLDLDRRMPYISIRLAQTQIWRLGGATPPDTAVTGKRAETHSITVKVFAGLRIVSGKANDTSA